MTAQSTMQTQNQLYQISETEYDIAIIISQDADKIAESLLQNTTVNFLQNESSAEILHNLNNELI